VRRQRWPGRGPACAVAALAAILVGANLAAKFTPTWADLLIGPAATAALLLVARRRGLTWDELGLARRNLRTGAWYGLACVGVVAVGYALALAVPRFREAFLDSRYHVPLGEALLTAFVLIPVGTVLFEEVAFRGVLLAEFRRHRGEVYATVLSSALFGLWHVLPSLRLGASNQAIGSITGSAAGGGAARVAVVAAAVGFTAAAGLLLCELRRRSGSLLAPAGLHWATNALGVLAGVIAWSLAG
jgi:membrane protease YdiL (CAAX protease family)